MSEWQTMTLGEITDWFSGGTPSKQNESFWIGEIPWISARTLKGTRVSDSELKISEEGLEDGSRLAEIGDLLLLVRGSGLFNAIPISIVESPVAFNQDIKAIRIKKKFDHISPWFLLYWFQANTRILNGIMEETGIGAGKFDLNLLKDLTIEVPPKRELEEITKTSKSIDDKITLLRQQNQDLEELAQTLFKRWFVEFEFTCLPSGYRPQGQVNLSSLAKVCTYKRVGGLPVPDGKSWFTYVLLCEDGSFYKGMTNDLYRRFYEHYIGEGANHTKTHKPVKVIHWEQFDTQDEARKREEELKTGYGRTWLQREYDKLLKYGSVASDGLPAQNEGLGLPAHQTRLMTAGKMVESELGEIPEGWRVGKLGEIIINHDSKRIPLSSNERAERKGKYPYHGATSIMDYVDDYIFDGRYLLLGEDGSVVDENGYPILQFVEGKIWVNNHAHVLEGKHPFSTNYIFLQLRRTKVNHIVTGAVQLKINQSNLNSLEMLIPTHKITEKFDDTTKEIFNKLFHNTEEIQTLTQLRDTLLPKLMSGELRIT